MEKPFKKVFGNRVYLEVPKMPESSIVISEESKKKWFEDNKLALSKFTVYAVGDSVNSIKEGDVVAVDQPALARAAVLKIDEGKEVIVISIFDVAHIW